MPAGECLPAPNSNEKTAADASRRAELGRPRLRSAEIEDDAEIWDDEHDVLDEGIFERQMEVWALATPAIRKRFLREIGA